MAEGSLQGPRFELELGAAGYPALLASISDPPERIYGIGNPAVLRPSIAIIGARKATPYGLSVAKLFAEHVAFRGLTIVSGGARGCDQAAHRAALDGGTPTIVVFGSGADVAYPKSGRALFERIIEEGGAIISESPWGSAPLPGRFPRRNRIIAGLALLLLIAEAGLPSGTFSTADAALSAGREVATVPGAITSPNSRGSNHLICQGATPVIDVETFDAALEVAFERMPLAMFPAKEGVPARIGPSPAEVAADSLLRALAAEAYRPDELTAFFGFSTAELLRRLSEYEMQGLVERGRDGRYQACGQWRRR